VLCVEVEEGAVTERAGVVVSQPLPVVEALVRDVSGWPALFADVQDVSRLAHDRYLVELRQGRRGRRVRTRAALVRVRWNAVEHQFSWHSVTGPEWSGELRLTPLTGRRTAVALTLNGRDGGPGWLSRLINRGYRSSGDATRDVEALRSRVAALPQPVRPVRLTPLPGARPVEDVLMMAGLAGRPEPPAGVPAPRSGPGRVIPAGSEPAPNGVSEPAPLT
jgi:hypothetical protein